MSDLFERVSRRFEAGHAAAPPELSIRVREAPTPQPAATATSSRPTGDDGRFSAQPLPVAPSVPPISPSDQRSVGRWSPVPPAADQVRPADGHSLGRPVRPLDPVDVDPPTVRLGDPQVEPVDGDS